MSQKAHVMHGRDHLPEGSDPIPGFPPSLGTTSLDATLAALSPSALWKLDESSGNVAHDSSGNGLNLTVDSGLANPLWGQPAGPPGKLTANFEQGTNPIGGGADGTACRVSRSWPAMTSDFTAGIWLSRNSTTATYVMGQGQATASGWGVFIGGAGNSPPNRPLLQAKNVSDILAANPLSASTWAFLAVTKAGTTWCLYVNGVLEGTASGSYTAATGTNPPLWIGYYLDPAADQTIPRFTGSYAFVIPSALTSGQLLAIYDSATVHFVSDGKVLTSDGAGSSSWEYPTIAVTY